MHHRGRVLRVTLGANPNSSSLGIDVTFLVFGGAAATLIAVLAASVVRLFGRGAKLHGPPAPADPCSAPSETR